MFKGKISLLIIACFLVSFMLSGLGSPWAADYPSKEITLICPYPVGGPPDIGARVIKPYWEKALGGKLVILNKPGAGGELGFHQTAVAKPDGYTICSWIIPNAQGLQATRKTTYKNEDFDFIGIQMADPHLIVARADDDRFKTINEFIDYAKKNPGKLKYGVMRYGDDHLAAERFFKMFDLDIKAVFVKKGIGARKSLLGKYIDFQIDNTLMFRGYVDEGQPLRVLAVVWKERLDMAPYAPTLKEATGKDFVSATMRGFMTTKGAPVDVLEKLRSSFKKAMTDPASVKEMEAKGIPVLFVNGEDTKKATYENQQIVNDFWKKK